MGQILVECRADIFSLILILILYIDSIKSLGKSTELLLLQRFFNAVFLYIASYSIHILYQKDILNGNLWASRILIFLKSWAQCYLAYRWFIYSDYKCNMRKLSWRRILVFFLPCLANIVLITISIFMKNGFIFVCRDDGSYSRGSLFMIQYVFLIPYLAASSIPNFIKSLKKEYYVQSSTLQSLAFFPVFPIIAIFAQGFVPAFFTVGIGITLSLLLVYINTLRNSVSNDVLTKINNRHQLLIFLSDRIKSCEEDLYLLIMDANKFKFINDNFGHEEGDAALIYISESLKRCADKTPCFICRYGGDEFIVVFETNDENDVILLCKDIENELEKISAEKQLQYPLTVSIGYAKSSGKNQEISGLIAAADEKLYEAKRAR